MLRRIFASIFLVAIVLVCSSAGAGFIKETKDGAWLLKGKSYSAKVDRKTGEIYEFINQQSKRDMFGGERGHLEISFPGETSERSGETGLRAGYCTSHWPELMMASSLMESLARLFECRHCSCRAEFTGLYPVFEGAEDIVKRDEVTGAGIGLLWPSWAYGRLPVDIPLKDIPTIILLPPYKIGGGYTYLELELPYIPKDAKLVYSGRIRRDNNTEESPVTYKVQVWNDKDWKTIHTSKVSSREWTPRQEIDLTDFAGEKIKIRLVAEAGEKRKTGTRLEAYWGSPKIVWGENALSLTQIVTRKILEPYRGITFKNNWEVTGGRIKDNQLILKQQCPGSDFEVESIYTAIDDAVIWKADIMSSADKDREISIDFAIPAVKSDSHTFDCTGEGVRQPGEMPGILPYRVDGTPSLPSFTSLNQKTDDGLTMIAPFEIKKPMLDFLIDVSQRDSSCILRIRHLRLPARGKGTAKGGLILTTHEGDWRPALGWMRKYYAEYFEVPHPVVRKYEANIAQLSEFYYIPKMTRDSLKTYAEAGANWTIGLILPSCADPQFEERSGVEYGHYIWEDVSPDLLKRTNYFIDLALEYGIGAFPYYQNFEADRHFIDKQGWQEWASRDSIGNPLACIPNGYLMNPADLPENPWRKHLLSMVERFMKKLPNIAGLWIDRGEYFFLDFSKDDGISMARGKPAYSLAIAKEDIFQQISEICNRYNKAIYSGGCDIETARWYDGAMIEGGRRGGRGLQYVCLAKPIFRFRVRQVGQSPEKETRWGLTIGAHMEIFPGPDIFPDPAIRRLLPLVRLLDGREWVLDAHALELPEGVEGNIFKRPNGDVIVPIVLPELDMKPRPVELRVRFAGMAKVKKVEMITAEEHSYAPVPFIRKSDNITVSVPELKSAVVLVLR